MFAREAQTIPRPNDLLFVNDATYRWGADDEAAIAAYWTGDLPECFALCWALLDGERAPDEQRPRIEANMDLATPAIAMATARYPGEIVRRLAGRAGPRGASGSVTLTVASCNRPELFEQTINSFLNCCSDVERITHFVCITSMWSEADRARVRQLYPFFEFIVPGEKDKRQIGHVNRLLQTVATPYWLYLDDDRHFIVRTDYVTRAISILEAEPGVAQVLFNRNFAQTLAERTLTGGRLYRLPGSGLRYFLHEYIPAGRARDQSTRILPPGTGPISARLHFGLRPSLLRMAAILDVGLFDENPDRFEEEYSERYTAAGWKSAFFDAVTCMSSGRLSGSLVPDGATDKPDALWRWQ
jgi:hypothetical protein